MTGRRSPHRPAGAALAVCGVPLLVATMACRSGSSAPERTGATSSKGAPVTRSPPPPPAAVDFELDGFQLGDVFADSVKVRAPYTTPCESVVSSRGKRRLIAYGPRRCVRARFPEGTLAVFFLPLTGTRGAARDDEPIEAFAWLGGSWFTNRSDFPLFVGDHDTQASATLGPPHHILALHGSRSSGSLIVRGHPGDVWSLSDGSSLVGFVVGPMPTVAADDQWQALLRLYETHGVKP